MFAHVGLNLPQTLQHGQAGARPETPRTRKSFEFRRSTERISMDRSSASNKSVDSVGNAFTSLSTVFRFADFANSSAKSTSENNLLVMLIQRVQRDVTEASRLRASKSVIDYCESWPDKQTWIDNVLLDVQRALKDIGAYVDSVKVHGEDDGGGTVRLRQKFEWVLSHQSKLKTRRDFLGTCHQSLTVAITLMQTVESANIMPAIYEVPATPWMGTEKSDLLRSPYSRQKWRMSQRNISVPSIAVSEHDEIGAEVKSIHSVNSMPVELAGSTPDDLPLPENMDLYTFPRTERHVSLGQIMHHPTTPEIPDTSDHIPVASARDENDITVPDNVTQTVPSQVPKEGTFVEAPAGHTESQVLQTTEEKAPSLVERGLSRSKRTTRHKRSESTPDTFEDADPLAGSIRRPQLAKRYMAKQVLVGKTPQQHHRSLPTQLPYLPSHPSLVTELSRFLSEANVQDSSGSYQGIEFSDTPLTSTEASPVIPISAVSCPERTETDVLDRGLSRTSDLTSVPSAETAPQAATNVRQNKRDSTTAPEICPSGIATPTKENAGMLQDSSAISRPAELEEGPQSKQTPQPPNETTPKPVSEVAHSAELQSARSRSAESSPVRIAEMEGTSKGKDIAETRADQSPSDAPVVEMAGTGSSAKQQDIAELQAPSSPSSDPPAAAIAEVASPPKQQDLAELSCSPPSPSTSTPPPSIDAALRSTASSISAQQVPPPMTSSAKRRRAHAKRMQAAYGSS